MKFILAAYMRKFACSVFTGVVVWAISNTIHANPTGEVVLGGPSSAMISGQGTPLLTINQKVDRAIIDWNSFSIGNGETTLFQFMGPAGAKSAVLNRVVGVDASSILGNLRSEVGVGGPAGGSVFLINPKRSLPVKSTKCFSSGAAGSVRILWEIPGP